ncbi:MAG: 2-oxoglutarate dehydrogenase E1 component [Sandaracinus sp.]|nr:2-oxoglutarate dehydrogenase E1 component [Sandaracinus sp.]
MGHDDFGVNQGLVEEKFLQWMANPASVDEAWRRYFDRLEPQEWPEMTSPGAIAAPAEAVPGTHLPRPPALPKSNGSNGNGTPAEVFHLPPTAENLPFIDRRASDRRSLPPSQDVLDATELQGRLSALINAYRVRGHLFAELDPLGLKQQSEPDELFLERYGLATVDPDTVFSSGDMAGPATATLREILERLGETYTRSIGVEFTFLEDREARNWLQEEMESTCNRLDLTAKQQLRILTKLTDAEIFEQFLHTKFIGAKRFSLEGGESVIPMLDLLIERASELGVEEVVLGMAHRGRLNVMVNIMEMNVREIFAGFDDDNPELHLGGGDVKYHHGYSVDRETANGNTVHLTLTFNPSHLEFVNPVVEGRTRAKQDRRGDMKREQVLPLLIHGDAAFIGQGIVAETLNLSELQAYETGGTVHVVINNQIGFTTIPEDSRATRYCTDITRMLRCPVFHVNGEDPEAVAQVVKLAAEYRQRFHRDVVIDLYCYRKYGHNEGDEPRFTQPMMYSAIDQKRTVREVYVSKLEETGRINREQADEIEKRRRQDLEDALDETRQGDYALVPRSMEGLWNHYRGGRDVETEDTPTGVPRERLDALLDALTTVPDWFTPHSRLKRFLLDKQRKILETGADVDWGTAENLAMASILADKVRVRLTGQDVRRGTFSHRHAVIFDSESGRRYTRLGHVTEDQAGLEIYDSPLSEAGVLGFEWGYSLDTPDALVAWEAQFGDFANGAQVIIDQFISSSEDKWQRLSGLVMLLPHGFEGMGPEHSSARLERFLSMCAEDNMSVIYPTTPAQIFHALRRQVVRPFRKPLIVMTPKSLLRHRRAICTMEDLTTGTYQRVIPEVADLEPKGVKRVILCSGKVYYDLLEAREEREQNDVAIVRMEQLYPYRPEEIQKAVGIFPDDAELMWVQEEPWNMGPWFFMSARLPQIFPGRAIHCVARDESASPATGSSSAHKLEQKRLVDRALTV